MKPRTPYTLLTLLSAACCLAAFAGLAQAQSSGKDLLTFEKDSHDFGEIKEADGKASHVFEFTNASDKPVKLYFVKASCGCTTPHWTREPIAPGKSGTVEAVYNANNRPGNFNKSITVRATTLDNLNEQGNPVDNSNVQTVFLRITGRVKPKPKGPEDMYPFQIGGLRFSTNHTAMGRLGSESKAHRPVTVYNASGEVITIEGVDLPGEFVDYSVTEGDLSIDPKDSVVLDFTYDAAGVDDYDFVHHRMYLKTDDQDIPRKTMYISANIFEDFSHLTAKERAAAPVIAFERKKHDFGNVDQGESVQTSFTFTNEGKRPLKLRKVKANCGCTVPDWPREAIAPGESAEIGVTFNSAGRRGRQTKMVTVISNAPDNPRMRLVIEAEVEVPKAPDNDH